MKLLAFIFASLTTHILVQGQTTEAPCYNYVPGVEYCPTDQPGVEFYYWDNQHCSKYYVCLNGCRESYTCPHDWLFDADNNWCTSPEQVNCGHRSCDGRPCKPPPEYPWQFTCPERFGWFADPMNCIKYYHCLEYEPYSYTCGKSEGTKQLYYVDDDNSTVAICDFPDRVDCGDRPVCDENYENCEQWTLPPTVDPGSFTCPVNESNGWFADPTNCIKYYNCINGEPVRLTCPEQNGIQELYNETAIMCDWPERVDCGDRPICDENNQNCEGGTDPSLSSTPMPTSCDNSMCTNGDGLFTEGPCNRCACQCTSGSSMELCCSEGYVWNSDNGYCANPNDVPGCAA